MFADRSRVKDWGLAFADGSGSAENFDRKATMVIEHLMQASDIGKKKKSTSLSLLANLLFSSRNATLAYFP